MLAGRVTDVARLLSGAEVDALGAFLHDFEARTRHQMVVVTIASLNGREISGYTRDPGNHWGIGRRGLGDGIVVLLAPVERRARIEVGKGLEAMLTDSHCAQVIETRMIPSFRDGRYFEGLMRGVTALASAAPRF